MTATMARTSAQGRTAGLLLMAEIPGYASVLRAVAAAHGEVVMAFSRAVTGLLDKVAAGLVPPYRFAKREGDAVLLHLPWDACQMRGDEAVDYLDYCYAEFRRQRNEAVAQMACDCSACAQLHGLELTFVLHWGNYTLQPVPGGHELLGSGVTTVQFLLKNRSAAGASALVTKAAAENLDLVLEPSAGPASCVVAL